MGFTSVAWSESQDSATLVNVAAVADESVRATGDNIIVPAGMNMLAGGIAIGADLTRAQFDSPSIRQMFTFEITPVNDSAEPTNPPAWWNGFRNPIQLSASEALNALAAEDGSGAKQANIIAFLSDGSTSPVSGQIFTVRATAAVTLVAFTWGNGALTLNETLPAGRYQVVGMRAESAGLLAARLVFVGGFWRPGCIGFDAIGDVGDEIFRGGKLGIWGEFQHDIPPTVDFLSISTDSAEVVYLDLIRVG